MGLLCFLLQLPSIKPETLVTKEVKASSSAWPPACSRTKHPPTVEHKHEGEEDGEGECVYSSHLKGSKICTYKLFTCLNKREKPKKVLINN